MSSLQLNKSLGPAGRKGISQTFTVQKVPNNPYVHDWVLSSYWIIHAVFKLTVEYGFDSTVCTLQDLLSRTQWYRAIISSSPVSTGLVSDYIIYLTQWAGRYRNETIREYSASSCVAGVWAASHGELIFNLVLINNFW